MVISKFCNFFFEKCGQGGGGNSSSESEFASGGITIESQDGQIPVPIQDTLPVPIQVPTYQAIPVSLNKHDRLLHGIMSGGIFTTFLNVLILGTPMFVFYFAESHPETPGWNFMLTSSLIYFTSSIVYWLLLRITNANIENDCFVFFFIIFHFSLLLCNAAMFVHNESGFIHYNAIKFMIFMYVMRLGGCFSPFEKNL